MSVAPVERQLQGKPYPAYKDSSLPWLSHIPAHWQELPGFSAYRERQVKNTGMIESTVLSLSYGKLVVKPPERLHGLVPMSFETYQIVDPGNIIIRPTDLQNDWTSLRVGLAKEKGIITSAYLCLNTVGPLVPEYGYLLLHTYDLRKVFYGLVRITQNLSFSTSSVTYSFREMNSTLSFVSSPASSRIDRLIEKAAVDRTAG